MSENYRNNSEIKIYSNKMKLVDDKPFWWACGNCGYQKYNKKYRIGKLELYLCNSCKNKINLILMELDFEGNNIFSDFNRKYPNSIFDDKTICVDEKNYHRVKCEQPFFNDIKNGKKVFDIRLNDRNYKKNDIVDFRLYNKQEKKYLNEVITVKINYIITGKDFCGIKKYCVFSFIIITSLVFVSYSGDKK